MIIPLRHALPRALSGLPRGSGVGVPPLVVLSSLRCLRAPVSPKAVLARARVRGSRGLVRWFWGRALRAAGGDSRCAELARCVAFALARRQAPRRRRPPPAVSRFATLQCRAGGRVVIGRWATVTRPRDGAGHETGSSASVGAAPSRKDAPADPGLEHERERAVAPSSSCRARGRRRKDLLDARGMRRAKEATSSSVGAGRAWKTGAPLAPSRT
jgi:hypothetical protein